MDALAALVTLLKPQALGTKIIRGAGQWGVRYPAFNQPSFALVLSGPFWLTVDGRAPVSLESGDFVLFPAMPGFTMASHAKLKASAVKSVSADPRVTEVLRGDATQEGPALSLLGGYFAFDPINASLLLDFLPKKLHIRAPYPANGTLKILVELIQSEAQAQQAGRSLVLSRLLEVMLVEALRSAPAGVTATGLLAGLRDPQLTVALHAIHTKTADAWTLVTLAREAGMSRSSFAERFNRIVGTTPLNYLLHWRLAVAKDLLAREEKSVGETAFAVGYESASGFSTAFSREVGQSPKEFIELYRVAS